MCDYVLLQLETRTKVIYKEVSYSVVILNSIIKQQIF